MGNAEPSSIDRLKQIMAKNRKGGAHILKTLSPLSYHIVNSIMIFFISVCLVI